MMVMMMIGKAGIFVLVVLIFSIQNAVKSVAQKISLLLPTPKYATKTAYDLSFSDTDDIIKRSLSWRELLQVTNSQSKTSTSDLQSCRPAGLYAAYRHGTRFPSTGDVIEFNTFIDKIRTSDVLNPTFKYLQNDSDMVLDLRQSRSLSETGEIEMRELARRLKKRFPELFRQYLHLNNYSFQSTNLSRTIDSTTAFISGLVDTDRTCSTHQSTDALSVSCTSEGGVSNETLIVPLQNKNADYLLRFFDPYEDCLKEQDDGVRDERLREDEIFKMGEEADQVHQRLVERLTAPGSNQLFNISRDEAMDLPKICAFQRALFNRSSWCSLLTPDDLRLYEYRTDLKHYWKRGYGHQVNYLVGCNLIQDIVDYMEQLTKRENNAPTAVFKFAHAETLLPLQCLLGLNKDDRPLLASDYQQNMYRKFRTSRMTPFAANVAFVLFKCSSEGKHPEASGTGDLNYKVMVLVNELPVDLPFCQNKVCYFKDLKTYIEQTVGRCDFNSTCCIEDCEHGGFRGKAALIVTVVGVCLFVCLLCFVLSIINRKYTIPLAKEKYRRYKDSKGHVILECDNDIRQRHQKS